MKTLLIEENIWEEEFYEKFIPTLKTEKIEFELINYIPFDNDYKKLEKYDSNYLFYGSLNLGSDLRQYSSCVVFNTPKFYECLNYYPKFNKYLLNQKYLTTTFLNFKNEKDKFFKYFQSDLLFIKPNSGEKIFTGIVVFKPIFEEDIEFITRYSDVPDDTRIIISPAKKLKREYRFLVEKNKVLTGSQYKDKTRHTELEIFPNDETFKFAQKVVKKIKCQTDPLWTIDIAEDINNKLFVLEIGCFSCCGLYSCNINIITNTIKNYLVA